MEARKILSLAFVAFAACAVFSMSAFAEEKKCSKLANPADERFAVRAADGKSFVFEDIGCAVRHRAKLCASDQIIFDTDATVTDYSTGKKIKMDKAVFAVDSGITSPLGFGIAAFETNESADAFIKAQAKGKIVTFEEINKIIQ